MRLEVAQKWQPDDISDAWGKSITEEEKTMSEAENKERRFYIQCPKGEKEEAKALGARWDKDAVKWYYTNPEDRDKFLKWLPDGIAINEKNKPEVTKKNTKKRYYIQCPKDDKEEAKKLGARWDKDAVKWYYTNPEDKDKFLKWLPDGIAIKKNKPEITKKNTEKRYYIQCPKDDKEEAKKLGARWDKDAVKWYYTNPEDRDKFLKWLPDDMSKSSASKEKTDKAHKNKPDSFIVYEVPRTCYRCYRDNKMLTYIRFLDDSGEDVVFPWDKQRLLEIRDQDEYLYWGHINKPSVEFYGLTVLGQEQELDEIMLKRYPKRIQLKESKQAKREYAMNICKHCGAPLGCNALYELVNDGIKKNEEFKIFNSKVLIE